MRNIHIQAARLRIWDFGSRIVIGGRCESAIRNPQSAIAHGHGPDDAELVLQVVPQPAVALDLANRAVESIRPVGQDVARIHVESLQHFLAGPGQLLHRVQDRHFVPDAQMIDQAAVRVPVDSRLEPAEVDRDPVGHSMIQCLADPLSGAHCLSGRHLPPR